MKEVTLKQRDRLENITAALSDFADLICQKQHLEHLLEKATRDEVPRDADPYHLISFLSDELRSCTDSMWGKPEREKEESSTGGAA
jgi:hypothetical protein